MLRAFRASCVTSSWLLRSGAMSRRTWEGAGFRLKLAKTSAAAGVVREYRRVGGDRAVTLSQRVSAYPETRGVSGYAMRHADDARPSRPNFPSIRVRLADLPRPNAPRLRVSDRRQGVTREGRRRHRHPSVGARAAHPVGGGNRPMDRDPPDAHGPPSFGRRSDGGALRDPVRRAGSRSASRRRT
jgi:hypothetical protein